MRDVGLISQQGLSVGSIKDRKKTFLGSVARPSPLADGRKKALPKDRGLSYRIDPRLRCRRIVSQRDTVADAKHIGIHTVRSLSSREPSSSSTVSG